MSRLWNPAIFLTLVASSICAQPANTPWPMFRRNLVRSGRSTMETGPSVPGLIWSYETGHYYVKSSPCLSENRSAYIGSHDNTIYCLLSNGVLGWSYVTGDDIWSSPALDTAGNLYVLYVGSLDNNVYAIDDSGERYWSYLTGDDVYSSPAPEGERVYVGSDDDCLYAIDSTGGLEWSYQTASDISSSPAVDATGAVYIGGGCWDNNLYAFNSNGSLYWTYLANGCLFDAPLLGPDGTIYVGSSENSLYAVNSDCSLRWSYNARSYIDSSPGLGSDGTLYVCSRDDRFYSVSSAGTLRWSYQIGNTSAEDNSSPAIGTDGRIFVGSDDRTLFAFNTDGSVHWSYWTGVGAENVESSPALAGEQKIIVGSDSFNIYCIGEAPTATPMPTPTGTPTRTPTRTPTSPPQPTATETPMPNYINLEAIPDSYHLGDTVTVNWRCDFQLWPYQGVPVNVYLAAIKDPVVQDAPSSVSDALSGGTVYLFGPGMKEVYIYSGVVKKPTYGNVAFPPAPIEGTLRVRAPSSQAYAGSYVFATAFVRRDTGYFVRPNAKPVENSNALTLAP